MKALLLLCVLLTSRTLRAHDEPTSYVDLRPAAEGMTVTVLASTTDLTHYLPDVEPDMLLQPAILAGDEVALPADSPLIRHDPLEAASPFNFVGALAIASGGSSYKGSGAANADMLGGQVKIGFPGIAIALQHHKAGRLLALGVTTAKRSPQMPDVPSISEAGLTGYDATFWLGLAVPKGTPKAIIDQLHRETTTLLKLPDIISRFHSTGTEPAPSNPEQFRKFIQAEYVRWGKVIREAGIKG